MCISAGTGAKKRRVDEARGNLPANPSNHRLYSVPLAGRKRLTERARYYSVVVAVVTRDAATS